MSAVRQYYGYDDPFEEHFKMLQRMGNHFIGNLFTQYAISRTKDNRRLIYDLSSSEIIAQQQAKETRDKVIKLLQQIKKL